MILCGERIYGGFTEEGEGKERRLSLVQDKRCNKEEKIRFIFFLKREGFFEDNWGIKLFTSKGLNYYFQTYQGIKGSPGSPGAPGKPGIKGSPGQGGDTGMMGDTGPTGESGSDGVPGTDGAPGLRGMAGKQGESGGPVSVLLKNKVPFGMNQIQFTVNLRFLKEP